MGGSRGVQERGREGGGVSEDWVVGGGGGKGEREGGAELGGECWGWVDGGAGMLFFCWSGGRGLGGWGQADGWCLLVVVGV